MKRVPLLRVAMAAGMYLFLMWGYMVLPSAQWFAVFLALLMSTMLVFWVNETKTEHKIRQLADSIQAPSDSIEGPASEPLDEIGFEASLSRLDALKTELKTQYAQLGRDQASINRNGLGSWHKLNKPR